MVVLLGRTCTAFLRANQGRDFSAIRYAPLRLTTYPSGLPRPESNHHAIPLDADHLSRHHGGLNPHGNPCRPRLPAGPLTGSQILPIVGFPSTKKGGDPVSYS